MKNYLFIIVLLVAPFIPKSQKIASFTVNLPLKTSGLIIPVSINLQGLTDLPEQSLSLSELRNRKVVQIPFQLIHNKERNLCFLINTKDNPAKTRIFHLFHSVPGKFAAMKTANNDSTLTIQAGNKNLLRYYYKTIYPPAGVDTNYKRSGFIHPLWTLHGQELTRIQPPDHYHHYGIWNPWTHVLFEKDTFDFWNIGDKKATVRFSKFLSQTNGPVFSDFEVLHEHIVFKKGGGEEIAINELQAVRVYKPGEDYFIIDIVSQLSCGTESPVLLLTYRYGGLGWRATEFWDKNNCEVITSAGKNRKNADSTKARWCIVQGALPGNDFGGAIILSSPANYNHPEPIRIWDENANENRGDMFFNFSPTKDKDWLLEPGKTYTLKYRLVVFNGRLDTSKAESAWRYFASPVKIKVGK